MWYISHYSGNCGKYYIIIITMQSKHCSNPSVSCYYSIAFVILQLRVRELPFTEHNPLFEWFYNVRVSLHVKLGVEVFPQEIIFFSFYLEKYILNPCNHFSLQFLEIILVKEGLVSFLLPWSIGNRQQMGLTSVFLPWVSVCVWRR